MFVEPGDPSLPADTMGSKENPRIWYKISRDSDTTVEAYQTFLENDVMDHFNDDEPQRTLLHDNLFAHKADEIYEAVYSRGHRVICRPPHRPYEAPIEWVFKQLACSVRSKWEEINNEDELIDEIEQGFVTGTLIEKHIENMSRNNESGISLSLVSALILEQFIMKII